MEHPSKTELDKDLKSGLEQTFPASDPVVVSEPEHNEPIRPENRRPPLIDKDLVRELAKNAASKAKAGSESK